MTRQLGTRLPLAVFALATLLTSPASAQMSGAPSDASEHAAGRTGWHVVREGETLFAITGLYLGSSDRWREIAAINPDLADPHRIEPGERLKVILRSDMPPRTALLVDFVNKVESQLNPLPWDRSEVLEIFRSTDALRTFENASALLRFSDKSGLTVTEETLVLLRAAGPEVRRRDPGQIEIRLGQADYAASAVTAADHDIEIVIGAATAAPKPDSSGTVRTRARVDQAKKAQLMVYGGTSVLSTASGKIDLETGTGTSVSAEGKAAPPERLLTAPTLDEPATGGTVPAQTAGFRWQPVDGAAAYVVEVCEDPACARLVRRETGVREAAWQTTDLPEGRLHWRATAVSASGLDGFPSDTIAFESSPLPPDDQPPWARVRFLGPQVTIPERFLVGLGTRIDIQTGDHGDAGVASWTASIDGKAVAPAALAKPWGVGEHSLSLEVVDAAGNRFEHEAVAFTYDPVSPILRWGRSPGHMIGETQGVEADMPSEGAPASDRSLRFEWAPGPERSWRRMKGLEGVPKEAPKLGIRPSRGSFRLAGTEIEISRKQPLWLEAEDALCRAVHLSALILDDTRHGPRLVVDAVDLLGNATRAVWPLERTSGKRKR